MDKLVLIGGGGHCRACIDVIESSTEYTLYGILDLPHLTGSSILGYPVIGTDDLITELAVKGFKFLITVGQIKSNGVRKTLFQKFEADPHLLATIISPKATVSKHCIIHPGCVVMHNAVINAGAAIGYNCIINTGALVEHDVKVGNHVHIATRAVINGDCSIGNNVFIGSGAIVINDIKICDEAVVGAGAVVNRPITENGIYVGNPYRKIK